MNKVSRAKNGSPRPENHVIVLFGATGDLARRKLLPGLFHLHAAELLPRDYRIIGSSPARIPVSFSAKYAVIDVERSPAPPGKSDH